MGPVNFTVAVRHGKDMLELELDHKNVSSSKSGPSLCIKVSLHF